VKKQPEAVTTEQKDVDEVTAEKEVVQAEEQKQPEATSVTVCDPSGHPHRTYSLEVHGEKFQELADEYVSHRPDWTLR
jgi:hypothetical protein